MFDSNERPIKSQRWVLIAVVLLIVLTGSGSADQLPDGLLAEIQSSKGTLIVRLHYDKAPMTVANFVGLAEGRIKWQDPRTHKIKAEPFYDGLSFHRKIPGVMVQAGDPKGNGNGGPGYIFQHEFHPSLRHDRPGILSMLNAGSYSHGSQFFISLKALPFFDDRHSVFGEIIEGHELLSKLEAGDRIIRVSILRRGLQTQKFDLENQLNFLRLNAEKAMDEAKDAAQKRSRIPPGAENRKNLPPLKGNIDPAKVPVANQPANQKVALEYLLITYKGVRSPVQFPYYDKKEARKVAEHLCSLAREKDADFTTLIRDFSDLPDYRIPLLSKSPKTPPAFNAVFHLREGQVSDPVEAPQGFYVFKRVKLKLIKVRHILISYQGAEGSRHTRTREQAGILAQTVLNKALAGEDFAGLARKYSDSDSAKNGGMLGEIALDMTNPAFEQAAFALKVNDVSNVTPTPAGFQIIKRIE